MSNKMRTTIVAGGGSGIGQSVGFALKSERGTGQISEVDITNLEGSRQIVSPRIRVSIPLPAGG
jgi:NAD(P)-dependent dehydrogenase (short-subunit alcohol dehydrogenase family)